MLKFDNTCIEYPNMTWVLDGMICSKIETQRSAQTIRANLMGRSRNCIQQTECHKHLPTFFTIRSLTFVLEFSDEELAYAKESFIFSLNLSLDNQAGILNNYVFHVLDNLPLISDRIKMIENITRKEIVAIASKIKPNISFILEGGEEHGNR